MGTPEPVFTPNTYYSHLFAFPDGMNAGVAPLLLPQTQCAYALNATFRGTFIQPRPPFFTYQLNFGGDPDLQTAVTKGLFQMGGYYRPDTGPETLIAQISGRLFQFTPDTTTRIATVREITIPGDPNDATLTQAWGWQSENYFLVNNGVARTIIFDGTTSRRSVAASLQTVTQNGALKAPLTLSGSIGEAVTLQLTVAYGGTNASDGVVNVGNTGQVLVDPGQQGMMTITGKNLNMKASARIIGSNFGVPSLTGIFFPAGTPITYFTQSTTIGELPPGRMGVYLMGRNWVSLVDGKQFIASDAVGGSSGTVSTNFRDAVLKISENTYLAGGGNFTVPGSFGEIQAMTFTAVLDASLGQGPLLVFTTNHVFTCQSPVQRLEWQDVTNPILSVALISNGATGQNSTVQANDDTLFRSIIGLHSLKLARLEFSTWGNVPINREVERVTDFDNEALLPFASAVIFDNRMLMTTQPTVSDRGVYHKGLVSLNFDPISTLRGKAPSIYDGAWSGLNVLQLITGIFDNVQRAFSFSYNAQTFEIELWEIEKSKTTEIADNRTSTIAYFFESPTLKWNGENIQEPKFKRLMDGEIHVDELIGDVDFEAYYKPDEWPCWIPWIQWSECAGTKVGDQPQFRPRMGLGQPSNADCDPTNNRPMREAYRFQFKLVVIGHARFLGAKFKAISLPEPTFQKPTCQS